MSGKLFAASFEDSQTQFLKSVHLNQSVYDTFSVTPKTQEVGLVIFEENHSKNWLNLKSNGCVEKFES